MRMLKNVVLALVAAVIGASTAVAAEITDVTGRKVEIELPAKRILLGEARQIHIAAALKGEHVFDTIVGWRDDLIKKDPDSYDGYRERFPRRSRRCRASAISRAAISASRRRSC
ncbi:ABC-type Fe3+-hydroxamate transport system substrate-binding protein [Sinorhizobium fredii]